MDNEKYYQYLDDLRDNGITNMFGAASYLASYLVDEFDLEPEEASKILVEWTKSYGERHEK